MGRSFAYHHASQRLADRGALRPGLVVDVGIDIAWTLCSIAVYDLLVLGRAWGEERYQAWLTDTLSRELLASGAPWD